MAMPRELSVLRGLSVEDMAPPEVIAERFRSLGTTVEEAGRAFVEWGQQLKEHNRAS